MAQGSRIQATQGSVVIATSQRGFHRPHVAWLQTVRAHNLGLNACKPMVGPNGVPDGVQVHRERDRPEHTTLYRLVRQHTQTKPCS